tara:strand:+ start:540 stop:1163 length:624 start_codon:yes stop_codon:yes gene_type:complete
MSGFKIPWLEIDLPKESIDFLWDTISDTDSHTDARKGLAGNISKSNFMSDKDDWFFKNSLEGWSNTMFFKDWSNYYPVHVSKITPAPKFKLNGFWVNYQKQYEFNPPHTHSSEYSFVVFMKIPTHWKEQHELPMCVNSRTPCAGDFSFLFSDTMHHGVVKSHTIKLSPEYEGKMLFFPSDLTHQVYPFYGTEEERITISGNIEKISG